MSLEDAKKFAAEYAEDACRQLALFAAPLAPADARAFGASWGDGMPPECWEVKGLCRDFEAEFGRAPQPSELVAVIAGYASWPDEDREFFGPEI